MLKILAKSVPVVKAAGGLVGAVKHKSDGTPVRGRKVRLVAAVGALAAAYGLANPEQADAIVTLILILLG